MALSDSETSPLLYALIQSAGSKAATQSITGYGPLLEAYSLLGDLLTFLVKQGSEEPSSNSPTAPQRISLSSGLLQASTVPECLISRGQYWAASAVIRQQLEALARLADLRNGKVSTDSKPPNVSILPTGLPQSYGRLSELAHVSNGEFLQSFTESLTSETVATALPTYHKDWSIGLLTQHIWQLIVLSIEIDLLHRELYPGNTLLDIEPRIHRIASLLAGSNP